MHNERQVNPLPDVLPGYAALGFRIRPDLESLERLLENAAIASDVHPAAVGEVFRCSGEYFQIWQNAHVEDVPPVLECSPLPGMLAFVAAPQTGMLIRASVVDPANIDTAEPRPVCFASPHVLLGHSPPVNELGQLSLTMLAASENCLIFDSPEALAAEPRTAGWPVPAFAATGLFDAAGNELDLPTSQAFLTGKVLLGVKVVNSLSSSHFWALRVQTQHGELFVCLPVEALDADPTGKFIAVGGRMSGSFPEWIPAPQAEPNEDSVPQCDSKAVEARVRELAVAFMETEDFTPVFQEIHPDQFTKRLATCMGIFNRDIRKVGKHLAERHQLASPELRQRYMELARTAPIVFANIVMADTRVLESGKGAPALVVLAWGEHGMDIMAKVRHVLSRVHFDRPENDRERELAAVIEDEEYHFGRRRRLPDWLTEGHEVYAADLWVTGAALDHERLRLRMEVVICFAEPGHAGLTMAIPHKCIRQAMIEMDPSIPKPPPLPKASGPPPLPGSKYLPPAL